MASTSATEPSRPPETNGVHVPTLPSNVSIFSPATPTTAEVLLSSRLFTRLTASPQSTGADGGERLASALRGMVSEGFCLLHGSAALVFDAGRDGEGVEDVHHEHVRAVCLALRDADVGLDIAGCVFDAPDSMRAGFQFDRLADGAVMVVDLMGEEDNDDDDDDDDGDDDDGDDEGLERFLREAGTSA